MTLELRPEIAAGLETLASALGLSIEDYLQELVERELPATMRESPSAEGGITIEDGLPIYRSSNPAAASVFNYAIERSREERSRQILGDYS